jgi:hypothetical protein
MTRSRPTAVGRALIRHLDDHTEIDAQGAVRSVQTADVSMPEAEMPALWTPTYLERLARTYWRYLSRISLGLIRVEYGPLERRVVLLRSPFVLLRFRAPEYETGDDRGTVCWRIHDGVLVARRDQGFLRIRVERRDPDRPDWERVHVTVEVENFYPSVSRWATQRVYRHTQSRLHVLIAHGFLRSLARRELEVSAVGRFAAPGTTPVAVGETPWGVVIGLLAAGAVAAWVIWRG